MRPAGILAAEMKKFETLWARLRRVMCYFGIMNSEFGINVSHFVGRIKITAVGGTIIPNS